MPRLRPTEYKVVESKPPFHGKKWRVIGYKDGQRKQYWFATEKEAKADAADRNTERAAYGSKVNLDPEARPEPFRPSELLRRHGKTITDPARYYLENINQLSTSFPFSSPAYRVPS